MFLTSGTAAAPVLWERLTESVSFWMFSLGDGVSCGVCTTHDSCTYDS